MPLIFSGRRFFRGAYQGQVPDGMRRDSLKARRVRSEPFQSRKKGPWAGFRDAVHAFFVLDLLPGPNAYYYQDFRENDFIFSRPKTWFPPHEQEILVVVPFGASSKPKAGVSSAQV